VKLARITLPIRGISFIRRHQYALAGPTQQTRQLLIQRRDALARISDPNQGARIINRE
jgi:hypothetical protein